MHHQRGVARHLIGIEKNNFWTAICNGLIFLWLLAQCVWADWQRSWWRGRGRRAGGCADLHCSAGVRPMSAAVRGCCSAAARPASLSRTAGPQLQQSAVHSLLQSGEYSTVCPGAQHSLSRLRSGLGPQRARLLRNTSAAAATTELSVLCWPLSGKNRRAELQLQQTLSAEHKL